MSDVLDILAVEPEPKRAKAMGEAFHRADFRFRVVSDTRKLGAAIKMRHPHAVLARGELGSGPLVDVLQCLLHDASTAQLPVFALCLNSADAELLSHSRTGVVGLLHEPFNGFEHPAQVRSLLAQLPERSGTVVGFEAARMVDHIQQTLRSGALKVNPGHPHESQAFFANGVLRWARHQSASGMTALAAMLALPRTPWAFVELTGQQGDGAGFVIELPKPQHAEEEADVAIEVAVDDFQAEEAPLAAGVLEETDTPSLEMRRTSDEDALEERSSSSSPKR